MVSRRTLLLGGAAVAVSGVGAAYAGIETGVLPGERLLDDALGRVDDRVRRARGSFVSAARKGRRVDWTLLTPRGESSDGMRLALVLPGRGGTADGVVNVLDGDVALGEALEAGDPPFALLGVACGERYWHPRADGDDPLGMLTAELLPAMRERGFDTSRIGALGWSMGGFGALLLARESAAGRLPGTRVAAACATAPALFPSAAGTSEGSFDSPQDWQRWGALAERPATGSVALRIDCGRDDPFVVQTQRYRGNCRPVPEGGLVDGAHEPHVWRDAAPAQVRFLGQHLA